MSSRSFPRSRRLVPRAGGGKPALLLAALILAGCGGGELANSQRLHGTGYSFAAPDGWSIGRTATSTAAFSGAVDRVEVQAFTLVKPYRRDLLRAAARELDGVA